MHLRRVGGWALLLAGGLTYWNALHADFIFDDHLLILKNPHITQAASFWQAVTDSSRPVVALTLALNYRLGGRQPWGYHGFNVLVHLLAGFILFALLRRTFAAPALQTRYADRSLGLSFAIALLWIIHPIQTESVTYVIQRGESLAGLFYLSTIYAALRSARDNRPLGWLGLAVLTCSLGMATKAVMVTAPLMVMLYDRAFLFPSWREALRRRAPLYAGLALTGMVLIACLRAGSWEFEETAGFTYGDIPPWNYLLTQTGVVLHYLRLTLWPDRLNLDYDWPVARDAGEVLGPLVGVAAALVLSLSLFRRKAPLGFLGASFFLLLAPTSSFIPIADVIFEHRMYLPLAPVLAALVLGGDTLLRSLLRRQPDLRRRVGVAAVVVISLGLALRTLARNEDYSDEIYLWTSAIANGSDHPRIYNNLGVALYERGKVQEAAGAFLAAIRRKPDFSDAHSNLGLVRLEQGRLEEAVQGFHIALECRSDNAEAHMGLALVLHRRGRPKEAREEYQTALRLDPTLTRARLGLEALQGQAATDPAS